MIAATGVCDEGGDDAGVGVDVVAGEFCFYMWSVVMLVTMSMVMTTLTTAALVPTVTTSLTPHHHQR